MNIGIILFSRTGNTLSVAEKIRAACAAQGHTAAIERVTAENEDPGGRLPVRLKNAPDPTRFDAVIFGAPVQGFSLSPIMKAYLAQMPQVSGKKVYCFVTQQFPKPWMGGKQAIKQMLQRCRLKGANAAGTGIVNWTSKSRDAQISEVAARFGKI
jgi:Flavodoxins